MFPAYTGQLTAPLDPLQTASIGGVGSATAGLPSSAAGIGATQQSAETALQKILQGGPQDLTGYYKTNVLDPLNQTFQQVTLPSIVSALGGSAGGPQSTAAQSAVAQATNNFMNTLAATQGGLAYQTGQADFANKLQAAQLTPGVTAAPTNTAAALTNLGGVSQANQQAALTAQYQDYLNQQKFTQQGIGDVLQYLNTQTQTAANQPVASQGSSGSLGSILGGIASIAALFL